MIPRAVLRLKVNIVDDCVVGAVAAHDNQGPVVRNRLTLIFIALVKNVFKANLKPMVKKSLRQN